MVDAYLDIGGYSIDASNNYAHWNGPGDENETLPDEYFASHKCRKGTLERVAAPTVRARFLSGNAVLPGFPPISPISPPPF